MRRSASIMNRNLFPHLRRVPALVCFAVFSLYQLTVPSVAMADEFGLSYYVGHDRLAQRYDKINV